jgi:integrase
MLIIRRRKPGGTFYVRGTVRVGKEIREVKEHTSGCRDRGAAEAYTHKLEGDVRDEILYGVAAARAKQLTCADAMLEYMRRPGGLSRGDVWRLVQLGLVLGDVPIADALAGWSRFKAERCTGLAPATVDRFRAILQAALNHAARDGGWSAPKLPPIRFQNQRVRFLTKPQQEALLAAYAAHVQPIALMLCFQGCRTQEALQLRWDDVDLVRGTVWFGRTKTGIPRTVALHARVVGALAQIGGREGHVFRSSRRGQDGQHQPYADTRDYKLPGGNPIRRAHETACRKAGIIGFRVHDWRHHWASSCVMAGVDLPTVMRLGGWKSLRMVERYAAVSTEHMAEAMRRLA